MIPIDFNALEFILMHLEVFNSPNFIRCFVLHILPTSHPPFSLSLFYSMPNSHRHKEPSLFT